MYDVSYKVYPSSPSAPSHLCVLVRVQLSIIGPIEFACVREYSCFSGHVKTDRECLRDVSRHLFLEGRPFAHIQGVLNILGDWAVAG